jgi:hypothetical protein
MKVHKPLYKLLLVLTALLLFFTHVDPAWAGATVWHDRQEILENIRVQHICQNELIDFVYAATQQSIVVIDGDGKTHVTVHTNWKIEGVGVTSGDEYLGKSNTATHSWLETSPGPWSYTTTEMTRLIRKGEGITLISHHIVKYNVYPDGTIDSEFIKHEFRCK